MELRELRYFATVARLGSITRAAETLRIAQPALSRTLRKLERELSVELVTRRARGVELTQQGSLLLDRAEELFQFLDRTVEDVRRAGDHLIGRVSVAVPPATGLLLVPEIVTRFREALPRAALHVREGVGGSLVEWVLEQRIDIAVVHNPPRLPELDVVPLVSEPMVLAIPPPSVPVTWERPIGAIALDEATRLPLILPSHPHTNRTLLDSYFLRRGRTLTPSQEVDSVEITKALVAAGHGATVLTYVAIHRDVQAGRLDHVPIERPPLISTLARIRLRDRVASPLGEKTANIIDEVVVELVRRGGWTGARVGRRSS